MKLAEALIERADIQSKLEVLRSRAINNAKTQEGVSPSEQPQDIIKEIDENINRLEYLIEHINKTNELSSTPNGTIAQLMAKRECLKKKISILSDMYSQGSAIVSRLTHTEIKIVPTFNVLQLRKQIDALSKQLREVDTNIQSANWLIDLV